MKTFPVLALVDDDTDDRQMIESVFVRLTKQIRVLHFSNGQQILNHLTSTDCLAASLPKDALPKLILLDLNMPIKDGRETLLELKSAPNLQKIPIVVFSSSRNPDDISYCYENGANAYVCKPDDAELLTVHIQALYDFWFLAAE